MAELLAPAARAGWRELHDPARGRRRLRIDERGWPLEALLADDRRLVYTHDEDGRLRRIDGSDGTFIAIELPPLQAALPLTIRVTDASGATEVEVADAGLRHAVRRDGAVLHVERDAQGRLSRVRLPGSTADLVYRRTTEGGCAIGPGGGEAVLTIAPTETGQRVDLDRASWEEAIVGGSLEITARDEQGALVETIAVQHDALGRAVSRRWGRHALEPGKRDRQDERYERDDHGRLASWVRSGDGAGETRSFHYGDRGDLVEERGRAGSWRREVDDGGRVLALERPDGTRVEYEYDASGRRTVRRDGAGTTRYRYDLLDNLLAVEGSGGLVEYRYDGLGRRIAVRRGAEERCEHRDTDGRLWAITDGAGRALHTFVWWGERLIARLDGPVDAPLAEAFLCDAAGTLLAVLRPGAAVERVAPPPFGAVGDGLEAVPRPWLYGHLGDPATGLVHFGARDYDPELGLFLTPDPWHGAEDDPRRWGGVPVAGAALATEIPTSGIHAYALCQFDPVGRVDRDGHAGFLDAVGDFFQMLFALGSGLSWGWALNAISLLFFLPLNLYFDAVAGLIALVSLIFGASTYVPWKNHHIWLAIGAAASGRQNAFAFGLNGFLPRVVSQHFEIDGDRAVTVGNVIWINRKRLAELDRPRVLDVWDVGGLTTTAAESVLAVIATVDGKKRVHASHWTRGFGDKVDDVPAPAPGAGAAPAPLQRIGNSVQGGVTPATIHLDEAFPVDFPVPTPTDFPKRSLDVQEYLTTAVSAQARFAAAPVRFALRLPKGSKVQPGHIVELSAPDATPPPAPIYAKVEEILKSKSGGDDTVFLKHEIPVAFTPTEKILLRRVREKSPLVSLDQWQAPDAAHLERIEHAAPVPVVYRKDSLFAIKSNAAAAPPPPDDTTFTTVKSIKVTLVVSPNLGGIPAGGNALHLLREDGAPVGATYDPAAADVFKLEKDTPVPKIDDRFSVKIEGAAATTVARVSDVTKVTPPAPPPPPPPAAAPPAPEPYTTIKLDPKPAIAAAGRVTLRKLTETNSNDDVATESARDGNTKLVIEVASSDLFRDGLLLGITAGDTHHARQIDSVAKVALELGEPGKVGPPFTTTAFEYDDDVRYKKVALSQQRRYLTPVAGGGAGSAPAAFGTWPDKILGIKPAGRPPEQTAYFLNSTGAAADIDPAFDATWSPRTIDGTQYWVLDGDLPIDKNDASGDVWHFLRAFEGTDINTTQPLAANATFDLTEYQRSAVACNSTAARQVIASPAEVQVPRYPHIHDTIRRGLLEHELHHTVQALRFGPFMNALPLQWILFSIDDFKAVSGGEQPGWLKFLLDPAQPGGFVTESGISWATLFSIGGLMEVVWKYVVMLPAYFSKEKREEILHSTASGWQTFFTFPNHWLQSKFPAVKRGEKNPIGNAFAQLAVHGLDLRSWTPFTGFVPTLLPDGSRSFLEQDASRSSGDFYSDILTANDRFNYHTQWKLGCKGNTTDADLKVGLGDVIRLVSYREYDGATIVTRGQNDQPGVPLSYEGGAWIEMKVGAGTAALFPPALYDVTPAAGTLSVEVDPSAAPALKADFLVGTAGAVVTPKLRAMVPSPPHVTRSAGFYFVTATPGTYVITFAPNKIRSADDLAAGTHIVTITVGGKVLLDDTEVPWTLPSPAGGGAMPGGLPALAPVVVERYQTEASVLKIEGRTTEDHDVFVDPPAPGADALVAPVVDNHSDWKLQVTNATPVAAADTVRVRLYRKVRKDDAKAFDLTYADVPTLQGVRNFLTGDVRLFVRELTMKVKPLPPLVDVTKKFDEKVSIDLAVPITGPDHMVILPVGEAPRDVPKARIEKAGAFAPHGEQWTVGPLADPIEDPVKYHIIITTGVAPHKVEQDFHVTFEPVIQVANKSGAATFEARKDAPLELTLTGGTAPYTATYDPALPDGTTGPVTAGNTVLITVTKAPPAATKVVVTIKDAAGRRGSRTIRLRI